MPSESLAHCQAALGYRFDDESLLREALTHSSSKGPDQPSNERLEFLGDAILGAVVSDYLFREFPDYSEGRLTKIKSVVVSSRTLGRHTKKLGVDAWITVGRGVAAERRLPSSILGNVFEAIIGAIFLDGGLVAARKFILDHLIVEVARVLENRHARNYKSLLQHYAQKRYLEVPAYRVVEEQGPDHSKVFRICVSVNGRDLGWAQGQSKKTAEQLAAKEALEVLRADASEEDVPAEDWQPESPGVDPERADSGAGMGSGTSNENANRDLGDAG